jgi:polynucleotide 5'-kinase involved in rRNA processing
MNITPQWDQIPVKGLEGIFMVIGGTDAGKSVFSRYLYGRLRRASRAVGFLDGDPGQSLFVSPNNLT